MMIPYCVCFGEQVGGARWVNLRQHDGCTGVACSEGSAGRVRRGGFQLYFGSLGSAGAVGSVGATGFVASGATSPIFVDFFATGRSGIIS